MLLNIYSTPCNTNVYPNRSLETSGNWNFTTVLEYIEVAQKTYEEFDVQDKECQKKVLCELVQTNNPIATEVGRQLSDSSLSGYAHNYFHTKFEIC